MNRGCRYKQQEYGFMFEKMHEGNLGVAFQAIRQGFGVDASFMAGTNDGQKVIFHNK